MVKEGDTNLRGTDEQEEEGNGERYTCQRQENQGEPAVETQRRQGGQVRARPLEKGEWGVTDNISQGTLNGVVEKYRPACNGEKRKRRYKIGFLAKSISAWRPDRGLGRGQAAGDVFTEKERLRYVYHSAEGPTKEKKWKRKDGSGTQAEGRS